MPAGPACSSPYMSSSTTGRTLPWSGENGLRPRYNASCIPLGRARMYYKAGDDSSLLRRYQTTQDLAARDELVRNYLPLIRSLAKRYSYTSEPLDDLCQVGAMALCKAIERYRAGGGSSFKAYAVPTIVGELRRHFRDTGWALHIPRSLQDRARRLGAGVNELSARLGRALRGRHAVAGQHIRCFESGSAGGS